MMSDVVNCHRCPLAERPKPGVCVCAKSKVSVVLHAEANHCPHPDGPRFGTATPPKGFGGGESDAVARYQRRPLMATDEEMRELFARDERLGGCGCAP